MEHLLLALPLGLLVGLSLGALGAGGSILTVPALVLVLDQTPHEAASTSLVVVGATAAAGAVSHYRRGAVRVRAGLAFAVAGVAGSVAGSYASVRTDPEVLALAFSAIMIIAAAAMWRKASADTTEDTLRAPPPNRIARTLVAGSAVGVLTGFFGIGGGFLAVPALTFALGLDIATAVGTSLLVISLNSATALIPRLGHDLIDLNVTAGFVIGGIIGASVGASIAHRANPAVLKRAFAITVFAIALLLASDTVLF